MKRRPTPFALAIAAAAAVSITAGAAVTARAIEMTPELKKIVEAAKEEGTIQTMSGAHTMGGQAGAKAASDWMKKNFGYAPDVRWTPGPPFAQLGTKVYTQYQGGQKASTDVYTATAVQVTPLMKKGLFLEVPWTKLLPGRITADRVEGNGTALQIATFLPGILYNLKSGSYVTKVNSMNDLLQPWMKGKFYTTPYLAGFDVLLSKHVWGVEKTTEYIKKLSGQVAGLFGCGGPDRIASGEIPALAIDCAGSEPFMSQYRGVLGHHIIPDNAQRRYIYLTVPKNAAHPNTGILFAVYFSTPEGQKDLYGYWGLDLDLYPGSHTGQRIAEAKKKGAKFTDVNISWWSKEPGIPKAHRSLIRIIRKRK